MHAIAHTNTYAAQMERRRTHEHGRTQTEETNVRHGPIYSLGVLSGHPERPSMVLGSGVSPLK